MFIILRMTEIGREEQHQYLQLIDRHPLVLVTIHHVPVKKKVPFQKIIIINLYTTLARVIHQHYHPSQQQYPSSIHLHKQQTEHFTHGNKRNCVTSTPPMRPLQLLSPHVPRSPILWINATNMFHSSSSIGRTLRIVL